MPKFKVEVEAVYFKGEVSEMEAESAEEAKRIVLEGARKSGMFALGFEFPGIDQITKITVTLLDDPEEAAGPPEDTEKPRPSKEGEK